MFEKPASGWSGPVPESAELTASDPGTGDQFGGALAISGGLIVSGALGHTIAKNPDQGAGYVFVKPTTGWRTATQTSELVAAGGAAGRQARPVGRPVGKHDPARGPRPSGERQPRTGRRLRLSRGGVIDPAAEG